MKCRQCGTEFEGKFCPECGAKAEQAVSDTPPVLKHASPDAGQRFGNPYQSGQKRKKKKPIFLRWWFILLVAAALVCVAGNLRNRKDDRPPAEGPAKTAVSAPAAPERTAAPEPSEPAEEEAEEESGGLDPEFKAAMDSYEAFMDEYVAFMKKYEASDGTDLGLLADYADYMSKYAEFTERFAAWEAEDMSTEEAAYYVEVQSRVTQKLLEAAG